MVSAYTPAYFSGVIDKLPDSFFIQGDFPVTRDRAEVLETGKLLNDPNFNAGALTGAQLEDLIFCLVYSPSKAIYAVLTERVTSRLLGLMWAFFQYNYNNENMIAALSDIEKKHAAGQFDSEKGRIIFEKGFLADPIGLPVLRVLSRKEKFADLITKYDILQDSPYFTDILTRFFIQAPAELIKENFEYLLMLFKKENIPVTALIRYLDVLNPDEFSPDVGLIITEKLGQPGISDFWTDYPSAMSQKMIDWGKIYKISMAYKPSSKKFKFLTKYSHRIKDTLLDEDAKIIKIIFGQFNVIDDMKDDNILIFCADPAKSLDVKDIRRIVVQFSAKDYIVRGTQAEYMSINLSGLDKMYADEMFDVLLDM